MQKIVEENTSFWGGTVVTDDTQKRYDFFIFETRILPSTAVQVVVHNGIDELSGNGIQK